MNIVDNAKRRPRYLSSGKGREILDEYIPLAVAAIKSEVNISQVRQELKERPELVDFNCDHMMAIHLLWRTLIKACQEGKIHIMVTGDLE